MNLSKEEISNYILNSLERPCTARTLMRFLGIDKKHRVQFQNLLNRLVNEGTVVKIKGNRYASPSKIDLIVGRYYLHRDGSYGFVVADEAGKPDVYVRTADSLKALPGDRVVARIESWRSDAGPRGRIIRILEEYLSAVVGKFEDRGSYNAILPFDRRINQEVFIPNGMENAAVDGLYVKAEITSRSKTGAMLVGKVTELLGSLEKPGIDRVIVQSQFGIRTKFSEDVIKEANSAIRKYKKSNLEGRYDFTTQYAVTIDGEDARDFDDAVYLEQNDKFWKLYVHIADVSEFSKEDGKLDKEAYLRGCSVYFPETAVPMFPEQISSGICSLKPSEQRLTLTCIMILDADGAVTEAEFVKSYIKSSARLTYTQVYDAISGLDNDVEPDICRMLCNMHNLSQKMRKLRFKRGAIDFNFPEISVSVTDEGKVTGIIKLETNDAHRIIEEFMIAANESVAVFLLQRNSPALFRIHEKPDPLKVAGFLDIYHSLGFHYEIKNESLEPDDFSRMLLKVKGSVYDQLLGRLMLRSMKIARYSPKNLGHFGLASKAYTHFTSPIRRYPDLVVHRALKKLIDAGHYKIRLKTAKLEQAESSDEKGLIAVASHCSIKERTADEAERELVRWRQVQYMQKLVGEVFDAVIIDIISYGIYIELTDYFLEGLIHVTSIYDDYYHYDERTKTLWGEKTHKKYSIGQKVKVLISKIDIEKRLIDFAPYGLDIRRKAKRAVSRRR